MDRVELERWKPREVARLLALLETERRYYQDIVTNLPVGLVIVSPELWLLSANRFFRQIFGLKGEEITRRRVGEVLRVDDLNDRILEVITNGTPQHNILYSPPIEGNSQIFRVSILSLRNWEDEMEAEALLVFEDLTGLAQQSEATPKAVEAGTAGPSLLPQPMEALPRAGAMLENFDAVVWECDPSGALTDISPYAEEMLGHSTEEFLSDASLWAQRVVPEDAGFVHELYTDAIQNRNRLQLEYRCRTAAGATLWVRESVRIQRDRSGNPLKISGVTIDITENRRLTERIVLSHKMESLNRLTSRVAHDFNNFLMVIGSYGEDLLQMLPADNPLRADVEQIVHAAGKVQDLTSKLLTFSRRPVPKPQLEDFGQIVNAALQEITAERLGAIEMVRVLDPNVGSIDADPAQVEKAIAALLQAAIDGSGNRGALTVETSLGDTESQLGVRAASMAVLTINSSAWELDLEARRRLFEPSFLSGEVRPLSEAYWFLKQNHAEIGVRGEAGSGVSIVVGFPATYAHRTAPVTLPSLTIEPPPQPEPAAAPAPEQPEAPKPEPVSERVPEPAVSEPVTPEPVVETQPEPPAAAKATPAVPEPVVLPKSKMAPAPAPEFTPVAVPEPPVSKPEPVAASAPAAQPEREAILVVEDEEGIRTLMRKILVRNGYEVIEAESGRQAIDLAKRYSGGIQLLVTDLVMPEMSGRELAEQLRASAPNLRVVFASGYTDDAVIQSGTLPPGTTYLQKPFTLGSLLDRVKEVLASTDM